MVQECIKKLYNTVGKCGFCVFVGVMSTTLMLNSNAYGREIYLKSNDMLPQKRCRGYIRADIGYSWPATRINSQDYGNKLKGALVGTVGIGHIINSKFRSDVTASYRGKYKYYYADNKLGVVKQKFSSTTFMVNGYISPKIFKYAVPYVVGGIGLSVNKAGNFSSTSGRGIVGGCSESLAWQIGLGSLITISRNVNADVMYKYANLGREKTTAIAQVGSSFIPLSPLKGRLTVHELSIGVSYFF